MASVKLGDLLVKVKVLREDQLKSALEEQKRWGGKLGEILVRMNFVTEDVLVKALSRQLGLPAVDLDTVMMLSPEVRAKLPLDRARDLSAFPLALKDEGRTLVVAMADPMNMQHLDQLRTMTHCRLSLQIAGKTAMGRAFARLYEADDGMVQEGTGSFKMVDAQGRTVVRDVRGVQASEVKRSSPLPAPAASPREVVELVRALEAAQRREVAALKAVVELLIEKGYFTREEYLAKVKRSNP